MSYEALIEYIKREGEKKCKEILEGAQKQRERMLSDFHREIEHMRSKVYGELHREIEKKRIESLNQAYLKEKEIILTAMVSVIDRLFINISRALDDLITGPFYRFILQSLFAESIKEVKGKVIVKTCRDDVPIIKEIVDNMGLNDSVVVSVEENNDIRGGVEVISIDGKFMVINTLWSRLEKVKDEMLPEIREIIFSDMDI